MNLKNNFIYGFIIFMFSLFLYSLTRNYIIQDELKYINTKIPIVRKVIIATIENNKFNIFI